MPETKKELGQRSRRNLAVLHLWENFYPAIPSISTPGSHSVSLPLLSKSIPPASQAPIHWANQACGSVPYRLSLVAGDQTFERADVVEG